MNGENSFKLRLNTLYNESGLTREEFAERCGMSVSAMTNYLNLTGSKTGNRTPDAAKLPRICEEFSVSADWLLGLSDVRKPSAELKGVVEFTGLTENAIMKIVDVESNNRNPIGEVLSHLIESEYFYNLMTTYDIFRTLISKLSIDDVRDPLPWKELSDNVILTKNSSVQFFRHEVTSIMNKICEADYRTLFPTIPHDTRIGIYNADDGRLIVFNPDEGDPTETGEE